MIWDGFFHLACWIFTIAGIAMLINTIRKHNDIKGHAVIGYCLTGWGLFNLIEGLVDHLLFEIHHVIEVYGKSWADYAFLLFGLALCFGGIRLAQTRSRPAKM